MQNLSLVHVSKNLEEAFHQLAKIAISKKKSNVLVVKLVMCGLVGKLL